jgi:hypothetical protein
MSQESALRDERRRDFYMIDNELIDTFAPVIGVYGLAVYNVIAKYANANGERAFPSYQTIADALAISRRKVIYCIDELAKCGLLRIAGRTTNAGDPTSNAYTLVDVKALINARRQAPPADEPPGDQGAPYAPPSAQHALPDAQHALQVVHNMHPINTQLEQDLLTKKGGSIDLPYTAKTPPQSPAKAGLQQPPNQPLTAPPPPQVAPPPPPPNPPISWQKRELISGPRVATAERLKAMAGLGIEPAAFRLLTDAVLDGCGIRALADAGDDRALAGAQDCAVTLARMDARFRTAGGIEAVFTSWALNDYRGETAPNFNQVAEHASLILAGKERTKANGKATGKGNIGPDDGLYISSPRPSAYSGIGKPVIILDKNGHVPIQENDPNLPY